MKIFASSCHFFIDFMENILSARINLPWEIQGVQKRIVLFIFCLSSRPKLNIRCKKKEQPSVFFYIYSLRENLLSCLLLGMLIKCSLRRKPGFWSRPDLTRFQLRLQLQNGSGSCSRVLAPLNSKKADFCKNGSDSC